MTTPPWADWFPMQTCAGCGDEHPGAECKAQDDLFGVSVGDVVPSHDTLGAQLKTDPGSALTLTEALTATTKKES